MTKSQNMIVAFGHNDAQYFVAAGDRTERANLPADLNKHIVGDLHTPITFASMGPGQPEKYFIAGYQPVNADKRRCYWNVRDLNAVNDALKATVKNGDAYFPRGASFGSNNSYSWWSDSECKYGSLGDLRSSWVKKMKTEYPAKLIAKLFLGAGSSVVAVWDDGHFSYEGVDHKLGDVFTGAKNIGLQLHHVAMSTVDSRWFFVQFNDMSVAWFVVKEFSEKLKGFAKGLGVKRRLSTVALPVTDSE